MPNLADCLPDEGGDRRLLLSPRYTLLTLHARLEVKDLDLHTGFLQQQQLSILAESSRHRAGTESFAPGDPPPCCRGERLIWADLLSLTRLVVLICRK